MRNRINVIFLTLTLFFLSSCAVPKNIAYFQNRLVDQPEQIDKHGGITTLNIDTVPFLLLVEPVGVGFVLLGTLVDGHAGVFQILRHNAGTVRIRCADLLEGLADTPGHGSLVALLLGFNFFKCRHKNLPFFVLPKKGLHAII